MMTTNDENREPSDRSAIPHESAGPSGKLGPIGRDRVHDGQNYYANDAADATGPGPAPDADGAGGSMGGGIATTAPTTTDAQTALGEPANGARGHIAGDSQGGSVDDGSAPDSQSTSATEKPG